MRFPPFFLPPKASMFVIIIFVWLKIVGFIFICKHYNNCHAKTKIAYAWCQLAKIQHSGLKSKCFLTFPIVEIMVTLWEICRPLISQTLQAVLGSCGKKGLRKGQGWEGGGSFLWEEPWAGAGLACLVTGLLIFLNFPNTIPHLGGVGSL